MMMGADSRLMLSLIHGDNGFQMDREVKQYLERERYENRNGFGQAYYSGLIDRFNAIQNSAPVRTAKAMYRQIINKTANIIDSSIVRLNNIGRMQNPPPVMYRYLLCNPTIRDLRYKDRIVGYRDEYTDPYGKDIDVEQIREYRNVVNGIYRKQDDKMVAVRYYEPTSTIAEITIDEQFDIFYSWNRIETELKTGIDDPTDKDNGAL